MGRDWLGWWIDQQNKEADQQKDSEMAAKEAGIDRSNLAYGATKDELGNYYNAKGEKIDPEYVAKFGTTNPYRTLSKEDDASLYRYNPAEAERIQQANQQAYLRPLEAQQAADTQLKIDASRAAKMRPVYTGGYTSFTDPRISDEQMALGLGGNYTGNNVNANTTSLIGMTKGLPASEVDASLLQNQNAGLQSQIDQQKLRGLITGNYGDLAASHMMDSTRADNNQFARQLGNKDLLDRSYTSGLEKGLAQDNLDMTNIAAATDRAPEVNSALKAQATIEAIKANAESDEPELVKKIRQAQLVRELVTQMISPLGEDNPSVGMLGRDVNGNIIINKVNNPGYMSPEDRINSMMPSQATRVPGLGFRATPHVSNQIIRPAYSIHTPNNGKSPVAGGRVNSELNTAVSTVKLALNKVNDDIGMNSQLGYRPPITRLLNSETGGIDFNETANLLNTHPEYFGDKKQQQVVRKALITIMKDSQ